MLSDFPDRAEEICRYAAMRVLDASSHEVGYDQLYEALRRAATRADVPNEHAATAAILKKLCAQLAPQGQRISSPRGFISDWLGQQMPSDVAAELRRIRP